MYQFIGIKVIKIDCGCLPCDVIRMSWLNQNRELAGHSTDVKTKDPGLGLNPDPNRCIFSGA